MRNKAVLLSGISVLVVAAGCSASRPVDTTATVICSEASDDKNCDYVGLEGLQAAVDASAVGASIRLLPGEYIASAYLDVPFQDLHVRGALVIDGKELSIRADEGAVIRGQNGFPVSAIVVRASTVDLSGVHIADFTYDEPEDSIYDGHGIFTIGSQVSLDDVSIEGIAKMALTGREDGKITARNLSIVRSHLGVWLEEDASVDISDSQIVGSESAALAIYGNAVAKISDSVIDGNEDDGLYAEDNALIESRGNSIQNNVPYGARAAGQSRILICGGDMSGNEADLGEEDSGAVVRDDPDACSQA